MRAKLPALKMTWQPSNRLAGKSISVNALPDSALPPGDRLHNYQPGGGAVGLADGSALLSAAASLTLRRCGICHVKRLLME